jgi:hypothetical protein
MRYCPVHPERGGMALIQLVYFYYRKTMKYLKNIALAILLGAIFSVSAYADGKPNQGGGDPSNGGWGKSNYGLSDSCWKVFLGQISSADAAKIAADQATITANQTSIDALNKQIGDLLKNGRGKRDSATSAQLRALEAQIDPLQKANGAAQMDIDSIIRANEKLFQTVAENCGRHNDDGGRDTTKGHGNPNPPDKNRGHFGLSDSCWNIFLSQLSAADAAQLAADQKTIDDNRKQVDSLLKLFRTLKGNQKDSVVRAEAKAIGHEINVLLTASLTAQKDYATILKKYEAILQSIRQGCGRTIHKGNAGDPTNGLTVSDIVPNPATVGSTASLTITLAADAQVTISIGSAIAQGPPVKQIFNGLLTAGAHTESLDLSRMGAGFYLVFIQSGNQQVVKKLVIQ